MEQIRSSILEATDAKRVAGAHTLPADVRLVLPSLHPWEALRYVLRSTRQEPVVPRQKVRVPWHTSTHRERNNTSVVDVSGLHASHMQVDPHGFEARKHHLQLEGRRGVRHDVPAYILYTTRGPIRAGGKNHTQ